MRSQETLNDHDEQFIKRQVESGRYQNRNDVIQAGLRMLKEFEDAHERWLDEDIPGRYAELQHDPAKAVNLDDARARFEGRHRAEMAKAK